MTSGVESHNALGICERYYEYLRQFYWRVQMEHKSPELGHILSLAVSAMNLNTGTRGLSPCLLVFRISTKLPTDGK